MTTTLTLCACGTGSVYALGLCHSCYRKRWRKTSKAPSAQTGYTNARRKARLAMAAGTK